MNKNMAARQLNEYWVYKSDGFVDGWKFRSPGDCEDYSLLILKHYYGSEGKAKDALKQGEAHIWYVITDSGDGHAILELDGEFIDNRFKKWMNSMDDMKLRKIKWRYPWWFIATRLAIGRLT